MSELATISPERLAELSEQGSVELIDVRTPVEFRELRATIARNVPLESLDPHAIMKDRNGDSNRPLYVICRSGNRSAKACQRFLSAGYTNVMNVEGGTQAWDVANLPVVRGKKAISLERQVRIAAGFIVLISGLLGIFVNPYFSGIAAFVGAGLMFAGIMDSCVMGMMLAKMPWNQIRETNETGCAHESRDS